MKLTVSHLLFDLDGTLSDPKIGITKSVQYALERFGIRVTDLDELEPFIGPPLVDSFREFYSFSEADSRKAVEYYREYFTEQGMFENELYPGMRELLDSLKEQGRSLWVATSKPAVFAEKIADYFSIARYFTAIAGSNLDGTRTDKADVIRYLLEEWNLRTEDSVMIGDRKHDIRGAHCHGMASIAVGYGYGSEEELRAAGPSFFVRTVEELKALFV